MKCKRLLSIFLLPASIFISTQAWAAQSAPGNVEAAPGNASAAVNFEAPPADTGTITGYTVTSNPSGGVDADAGTTSLIHVITGLTNGQAYTFTVTATNSGSETSPSSSPSSSVTPSTDVFAPSAGTWNVSGMMSGAAAPFSQACTMTCNQDGTVDSTCSTDGGTVQTSTGNVWVFPDGIRFTVNGSSSLTDWLCQPNPAGTVLACTASVTADTGSAYMSVATRQGTSYSIASDLAGPWSYADLELGTGSASWSSASMEITGTGTMTGTSMQSSGTQNSISAVLSLSSTGVLTCVSGSCGSGTIGYLDAGQTVAAGVTPNPTSGASQNAQLQVLLKNGLQYSMPDLYGTWYVNQLNSDGTWQRHFVQIFRGGAFSSEDTDSTGTTTESSGRFAISSTGQVTCVSGSCSGVSLALDAGKSVMTGAYTDTQGADSIAVATRSVLWCLGDVPLGNGWEYSKWFGYVNASHFPWLYHTTLGWLWPYQTGTGDMWFYDPQWNGTGGWWWTSSTTFPWIYSETEGTWLYYDTKSTRSKRWFGTVSGHWATH